MITSDPIVSEYASHIERSLARAAQELGPEEFKGVIGDPGLSVLRTAMDYINADFISIWFADQDQKKLVVTHSEPDPSFIGWEQSISEGLISLAYASEQSLCENQVYLNAQQSKRIDEALNQVTCAMIVTPFYMCGTLRGVISTVQIKDSEDAPDPPGFSASNLNRMRRLSTVLERLVNYRLLTRLLDLEL